MLSEYLLFSLAQRYVIYLKELVEEPLQKGSGDSPTRGSLLSLSVLCSWRVPRLELCRVCTSLSDGRHDPHELNLEDEGAEGRDLLSCIACTIG